MKRWLALPVFANDELNRLARSYYFFLLATLIISDLLAIPLILNNRNPQRTIAIFGVLTVSTLVAIIFLQRGHLARSGRFFLSVMWAIITYVAVDRGGGGLSSPAIGGYLVLILAAALFLGVRTSLAFTLISIAALGTMFVGEWSGLIALRTNPPPAVSSFVSHILIFSVGLVLSNAAAVSVRAALAQARSQEEKLRAKNREMEEVLASLEERITERTEEISQQKQFFEALVLNSPVAIVTLNLDHRIQSCNPAFERLFGYAQNESLGKDLDDLINTEVSHDEAVQLTHQVAAGETIRKSTRRKCKDGRLVDVHISGVPVLVNGRHVGSLALYHDISDRIKVEENLKYLATHDPLTVLPNRALFYDHLDHSLHSARRNQARLAVFFLDLDGFKYVNDRFGHSQGDEMLQEVAIRFRRSLRTSDLVARLGGDEFAFVCDSIHSPLDAARIATKILKTLSQPFILSCEEVTIHGSLGISLFPEDGDEARELLQFADAAMYRVKRDGKNHFQFYSQFSSNKFSSSNGRSD